MYLAVKDVKPMDQHLLLLTFENGQVRTFDMRPYLNIGIFKELQDISMFNTVRISFDTIAWANDADLDPELLYKNSKLVE
ncbi:MAG: DUF2442 domain-containing protein [Cytophagales bacterium]|nr:DUF2442 domain-containing protein [Cytophagales bacterium]